MGAQRRLARVKGALAALLRDAYARRDRVAVVAFRDEAAEVLVPPGAPLERAAAALAALPTGGRTPLAAGLRAAELLVRREAAARPGPPRDRRRAHRRPRRATPTARSRAPRCASAAPPTRVQVVDTEDGPVRLGLAATIARRGRAARAAPPRLKRP